MADFTLAPLLRKCSDDDLEPLVKFIKKAELTETLSESYGYCTHYPKHSKYADQIAHHIRLFGGNTIVNIPRGEGPPYKEIVQDVANKLGVNYEYYDSVERVEMKIIKEIFDRSLKEMSDKKKEEVFKDFKKEGEDNWDFSAGSPLALLMAATVANGIAKMVLGRVIGGRVITILAGPIGWVITGIWTAISIAGPAYRVTIPCVCHVAYLRQKIQAREDFGGDE